MHTGTTIHMRAAASLALLLLASSAVSKVYRCEDGAGNVTFSDKGCGAVTREYALESDGLSAKERNVSVEAKGARTKRVSAVQLAADAKALERKHACEQSRTNKKCDGSP